LSSTLIGHDSNGNPQFDTKRSELGELVYRLKNRSDRKALAPIAEAAVEFIKGWAPKVDAIVPVPPSRKRAYQPVVEIAKAIGRLLADKDYRNVIVHCMTANCRNNVGGWPAQEVAAPPGARGFAYYSTKDQAMVDAAEYGFMLWDGESKGTLNSVINMIRQEKPVVVDLAPKKTFQNLRSSSDAADLLTNCDRTSVQRLERELGIEGTPDRAPLP
jgi:hypothetical protein